MKLTPDQKAGIYITVSIHLAVIVVFLLFGIGSEIQKENSFVLDFTQQEEMERRQEEAQLKEITAEQIERLLAAANESVPIRNVAVDRASLKDDKGINAEELYKEAERLARDLKEGQHRAEEDPDAFAAAQPQQQDTKNTEEAKTYSGPSVLSWSLDGRKATHLPIPAYRCYGAGQVTVIIAVNNRGDVVNAKIDENLSANDGCLRTFAVRAARLSKFSMSQEAPARQMGTITYEFIAQ